MQIACGDHQNQDISADSGLDQVLKGFWYTEAEDEKP